MVHHLMLLYKTGVRGQANTSSRVMDRLAVAETQSTKERVRLTELAQARCTTQSARADSHILA